MPHGHWHPSLHPLLESGVAVSVVGWRWSKRATDLEPSLEIVKLPVLGAWVYTYQEKVLFMYIADT